MDQQIETVTRLVDTIVGFLVAYGFQILGALLVLVVGLKIAAWTGRWAASTFEARKTDPTLAKFIGNLVRLTLIALVVVITLGNFGITVTPLIALAGASAFGATLALQGPLSNYGAGLSIVFSRPFVVGETITVGRVSGVVDEITLACTVLLGEDGERVRVPNKEIIGKAITNSRERRVVQTKICLTLEADIDRAIGAVRGALAAFPELNEGPPPQVGVHDFTYGGIVLGVRFWVPSLKYFQTRYAANKSVLGALNAEGIGLLSAAATAIPLGPLSADLGEEAD